MIFDAQFPRDVVWNQRKTALLTAIFGAVPLTLGNKIRRLVYRSLLGQIEEGVNIGTGVQLAGAKGIFFEKKSAVESNSHLNCWGNSKSRIILRSRSRLDQGAHLQALGGCIEIGEMTYIGPYFCAAGPGDIKIGKYCMIASHASAYANNHIFSDPNALICSQGATCKGIVIEDDCWLGTGVRVLDGVTIGKGSVIGAGAVVTKSIPPYSIAVGVPAKVIGRRGAESTEFAVQPGELIASNAARD
ncbi:acyltransferase [Cyanobacteria bacterium FACHB-502]|nr:acyltransferase [Cyanobacteria bacterium FACHB-502]MBD2025419.1 acyltransferase [Leptolyngbya sp. FACHB-711]